MPARLVILLWLVGVIRPLRAQSPAGTLIEHIRSAVDSGQSYAVLLPPGYSPERRWPVLFVLDPRGRSLLALDLFRAGAARLGWMIVSSYGSRSDGPADANVRAMNAMLAAVQGLPIDTARLYLAGFSGTARDALRFAVQLRGRVAGVIAIGGALRFEIGGPETTFARDQRFAYFGGAGDTDFNHEEVRRMGDAFRSMRVPTRVVLFRGPHRWPPAATCEEALDWLELRAMLSGLRPLDSAWARARLERDRGRVDSLERAGQWDGALRLADETVGDFGGWPGSDGIARRAQELRAHPVMRRYEDQRRRLAEHDARQGAELLENMAWVRRQQPVPSLPALANRLQISKLQELAARGDSLEAISARRLLARTAVFLSFYVPRADLADGAPERALRMLEAARLIGPIEGEGCGQLREAVEMSGREPPVTLARECGGTQP
jgi:predicted esterase